MNRSKTFKISMICSAFVSALYLGSFAVSVAQGKNTEAYLNSFHQTKHYSLIKQPSKQPDKQLTLFFWYGSPSSFNLEPKIKTWIAQNEDVVVNYIPATLNKLWIDGARTFYALEKLGIEKQIHDDIYFAYANNVIKDKVDLENFLSGKGVEINDFWEHYFSGGANKAMNSYSDIARNAELEQIPTLIVSGKYKVHTSSMKSWKQTFELVDYLIKTQPQKQLN